MQRTFYDLLGVSPAATNAEIKAAWRRKAQMVHPDKIQAQIANLDPYAAERLKGILEQDFRDLKEAYDVLSDLAQRKEYDDLLRQIQGTSTPPPVTPRQAPAPQPPSPAQSSSSFCTTCGTPLVGNRCDACAKQQSLNSGFGAIGTGIAVIVWVTFSIVGVAIAVTAPQSWDADTCIGILVALAGVILWGIHKGLWGGTKRLFKTHPKIGVFATEAISLVVLSLAVGAFNSPATPPSTHTPAQSSSLPYTPIPDAKLAIPEIKAQSTVDSRKSAATPLMGRFDGTVRNETAGLSANFGVDIVNTNGHLAGCMVVKEPLFGTGALLGVVRGPDVSFVVTSPIGDLNFSGHRENDRLRGTYTVKRPPAPDEIGTFVLQSVRTGGDADNFDGGCFKQKAPVTPSVPRANLAISNPSSAVAPEPLPGPIAETSNKTRVEPDISELSIPEQQSIESVCLHDKLSNGPAAYNHCLLSQLEDLREGPQRPDLSNLSVPEQQSIESSCLHDKLANGPVAYNHCLITQLENLREGPRRPDLSKLSVPEQQSIESACLHDKLANGPAAYDHCLVNQLGYLATGPKRPDLSGLSLPELQSIESACLHDKLANGPAAYNHCLVSQLDLLGGDKPR